MSKNPIDKLFDAIKNNNEPLVRNIIANLRVDINCVELLTGMTPLLRSIFQQSPDLVKLCLELGADVNKCAKVEGEIISPIMRATYQQNRELVSILITDQNIKLDIKEKICGESLTPYERAFLQDDFEIAWMIGAVQHTEGE